MRNIYVSNHPGEQHVALLEDGVAQEYYIHRPVAPDGIGDVYVARVLAVVPAMGGAFVALAEAEAFLPDTEANAVLSVGTHLAVRVTRAGQGGKGPRVSARVTESDSAGPVRLLRRGPTPLEELVAAYPDTLVVTGAFDDALAADIARLAEPEFVLPGGMRATATPTPALTAIDMDGGTTTGARVAKAQAQFAANSAALPEIARQIRLRNFGGAVLVDFAGMPAKKRAALLGPLQAALAQDRMQPRLAGFSALGFAEIARPRLRPPLHEKLRGPLAAGLAALRQAASQSRANPAQPLALRAPPAVITALQADTAALADLAHVMTHPLMLRSDPALSATLCLIEPANA